MSEHRPKLTEVNNEAANQEQYEDNVRTMMDKVFQLWFKASGDKYTNEQDACNAWETEMTHTRTIPYSVCWNIINDAYDNNRVQLETDLNDPAAAQQIYEKLAPRVVEWEEPDYKNASWGQGDPRQAWPEPGGEEK